MGKIDATGDPRTDLSNHLGPMRAFAMSLTRNSAAADDLVQDTVLKAWKNIDSFERGTNMQAWLFTILRNTFYSSRRKLNREVEDIDGIFAAQLSEKPAHDGKLALGEFFVAYAKLPVEQREALALVGASGYSYEEAAATCGVAIGTIKSRVNRGRARLAEMLALQDGENPTGDDPVVKAIIAEARASGYAA